MTGTSTTGTETTPQELTVRPDEVDDQLRANRAADLRRDGYTWAEIADELDYASGSSACRAVSRLVRRESAESASEYRALMIDRYEGLWRAAWQRVKATDADPAAVTAAVRVADRLVALTGADQPATSGESTRPRTSDQLDHEIAELITQIENNARAEALGLTQPEIVSGTTIIDVKDASDEHHT